MHNFVHMLLRILAGIAGALLLYIAFFLYEDEEARIQNRLEQIWKQIDTLHGTALTKEAVFVKGATRATSGLLDHLLGRKLLSLRFVAVSSAFSVASVSLVMMDPLFYIFLGLSLAIPLALW